MFIDEDKDLLGCAIITSCQEYKTWQHRLSFLWNRDLNFCHFFESLVTHHSCSTQQGPSNTHNIGCLRALLVKFIVIYIVLIS